MPNICPSQSAREIRLLVSVRAERGLNLLRALTGSLWDPELREQEERGRRHHKGDKLARVQCIRNVREEDTDDQVADPIDEDTLGHGGSAHGVSE